MVKACLGIEVQPDEVVERAALELLAARLRTPLQIEQHLTLAFEAAFQVGEKPITPAMVESVLSKQLDDLEPTLTRHGYNVKTLSEQFSAKPAELRLLFRGQLEPAECRSYRNKCWRRSYRSKVKV